MFVSSEDFLNVLALEYNYYACRCLQSLFPEKYCWLMSVLYRPFHHHYCHVSSQEVLEYYFTAEVLTETATVIRCSNYFSLK